MNNLPDDRTRLLAETLEGDWTTGPAAAMARRAAAHARRRRATKAVALPLAAAAAIGAIFFFSPRAPVVKAPPVGYEIISDEELLATLRDRPLLVLPQENGPQKIVVLDR